MFAEYRPDVVYHAAAHKHVPLMETSPCEAIKNNVLGTYKTASAALQSGCEKFVLISTDKAVNPTNIMGASKRLCEMVIQTMDRLGKLGRPVVLPDLNGHEEEADYVWLRLPGKKVWNRKKDRGSLLILWRSVLEMSWGAMGR